MLHKHKDPAYVQKKVNHHCLLKFAFTNNYCAHSSISVISFAQLICILNQYWFHAFVFSCLQQVIDFLFIFRLFSEIGHSQVYSRKIERQLAQSSSGVFIYYWFDWFDWFLDFVFFSFQPLRGIRFLIFVIVVDSFFFFSLIHRIIGHESIDTLLNYRPACIDGLASNSEIITNKTDIWWSTMWFHVFLSPSWPSMHILP